MVYYFESNVVDPSAFIYVGKDKVENEELIRYGWEEDVCSMSTISQAHIYTFDYMKLTKANSIEGNKKDNITVIYTPWSNLKKDGSMAVGQVGFKDNKNVKRIHVPARENPIVNRLNKTKKEEFPDLAKQRDDRLKELQRRAQAERQARQKEELRIARERKEKKWTQEHAYDDFFDEENLAASSNQNREEGWEDDFM